MGLLNVLYIEDNFDEQKLVHDILADHVELTIINNGADAVKNVRENEYDLILADINLGRGKLNGIQFIQHIRRNLGNNTPIIAVSGDLIDNSKNNRKDYNLFIKKPYNVDELRNSVLELGKK